MLAVFAIILNLGAHKYPTPKPERNPMK